MDILTALDRNADYSKTQLQFIFGAWVLSGLVEKKKKIKLRDGDVAEDDYDKRSIYSLLYALYRSTGMVKSETGERYEFTFNTWGYAWPDAWGTSPISNDRSPAFREERVHGALPIRRGQALRRRAQGQGPRRRDGLRHGRGRAPHVQERPYRAAPTRPSTCSRPRIRTCKRKFVPELGGRLIATCADATDLDSPMASPTSSPSTRRT